MSRLKILIVALFFAGSTLFAGAQTLADTMAASGISSEIGKGSASSGLNAARRAQGVAERANAQQAEFAAEQRRLVGQREPGASRDGLTRFLNSLNTTPPPRTIAQTDDLATTPLIGLDGAVNLLQTSNIFRNREVILQWLGENPKFKYDTNDKEDPMLVPWLADEYRARVLEAEAKTLWEMGGKENWATALFLYERILILYVETEVAQDVYGSYEKFRDQFDEEYNIIIDSAGPNGPIIERILFPEDIKNSFSSILAGRTSRKVLIKNSVYQEGDEVLGGGVHPVVIRKIVAGQGAIRDAYVVFDFNGKEYWFMQHGELVPGHVNPEY